MRKRVDEEKEACRGGKKRNPDTRRKAVAGSLPADFTSRVKLDRFLGLARGRARARDSLAGGRKALKSESPEASSGQKVSLPRETTPSPRLPLAPAVLSSVPTTSPTSRRGRDEGKRHRSRRTNAPLPACLPASRPAGQLASLACLCSPQTLSLPRPFARSSRRRYGPRRLLAESRRAPRSRSTPRARTRGGGQRRRGETRTGERRRTGDRDGGRSPRTLARSRLAIAEADRDAGHFV